MKISINNIEFNVNEKFNLPFWDCLNAGDWEQYTFEIIDYFVSENSRVLDIGCWIGPLSLYMAGKGAHVYSIEPDPIAYEELMTNLKLNPVLNQLIHPFNFAIAPDSKNIKLYARKAYGDSSSSILNRIRDTSNQVHVKGVSFDQIIKITKLKQVDFIKMDIEGGEFEVLPGIVPMMVKIGLPTIFISFHYSYLNEFIHQKKIGLKYLSLLLMKVEKILNYYLFKIKLTAIIKSATSLFEEYKYIYTESGDEIQFANLSPDLMMKNRLNLLLSNKKWVKQVIIEVDG